MSGVQNFGYIGTLFLFCALFMLNISVFQKQFKDYGRGDEFKIPCFLGKASA